MTNLHVLCAVACAVGIFPDSATALPSTSLGWVQQTGTASPFDPVEVWVRLTVDAGANSPLVIDGTTASFDASELTDFATIEQVSNQAGTACRGSFFGSGCADAAAPWRFAFNGSPTQDNWLYAAPMTLLPGESKDFLFGSFTPLNGPVAPGIYSWDYGALLSFVAQGTDAAGDPLASAFVLGNTCEPFAQTCAFTRTVDVIPEPGSYALFVVGFLGLAFKLRRAGGRGLAAA